MSDTVRIDDFTPAAWDALVAGFDDADYDQTAFLGECRWGADRLSRLAVLRDGAVVGGAQVFVFRPPLLRSLPGIAHVKFGPLWRSAGAEPCLEDLETVLDALVDEYVGERGLCLTVVPKPDPEHMGTVWRALEARGFRRRREVVAARRYIVDASLDADAQRKSLGQKWRYNLKKAEKAGLDIRIVEGAEGADAFMALHAAMRGRKSYRDASWVDRFPELLPGLPAHLSPEIVLAYHDGTPTAGAAVGRLGNSALYLFGGTDSRALALRAGYALQWWIIGRLAREGVRWYDLDSDSDDPGLRQFKNGLAGKAGHVLDLPGELDYWESTTSRLAANAIQSIRATRNAVRDMAHRVRAMPGV